MMKVIVMMERAIVPMELVTPENKEAGVTYSTMHPIQSPYFKTRNEVIDWATSNTSTWKKFKDSGMFAIYRHDVALQDMTLSITGYKAVKGEILSTDESAVYDFKREDWI